MADKPVPKKLKHDAIVEALLEIRFDTLTIPEVLLGRVADSAPWKGFGAQRLPVYEIPAPIREVDPNLRFQALFELRSTSEGRSVRVGPHVLSYHRLAPYVGWERFRRELDDAVEALCAKTENLRIRRLGLRYINALRPDIHGIGSISDLDMQVEIASERLSGNVNLNFNVDLSKDTSCTVRVATTEFVKGDLPVGTSVLADVDVFTKDGWETSQREAVGKWVEFAHEREKEQFFRLLTIRTIQDLKEA